MSGFTSFGGGAATNPNIAYETLGWDTTNAIGTVITANGSNHTKGAYASLGTTSAAWSALFLRVVTSNSSGGRFLIDVSLDGSTVYIPDLYVNPGTTTGTRGHIFRLPMQVPASTNLRLRQQCSTGGLTIHATAIGIPSSDSLPPGFTTAAAINAADAANTRPSSTSITQTTGATTWTELEDSTLATYGAILAQVGNITTPPTTAQQMRATLATGAAAAEAGIGWIDTFSSTGNPNLSNAQFLIERQVASGTRLSANVQGAVAGAPDTFCMGLIGFS